MGQTREDGGWLGEGGEHRALRDASLVRGKIENLNPSPGASLRSAPPSPARGEGFRASGSAEQLPLHRIAAVDRDGRAGDEVGSRAGEEHGDSRPLVQITNAYRRRATEN